MVSSSRVQADVARCGLDALRELVQQVLRQPLLVGGVVPAEMDLLLNAAHRPATSPRAVPTPGSTGPYRSDPAPGDAGPGDPGSGDPRAGDRDSDEQQAAVVELVRRAQRGDAEAFGQLYDRYSLGIYRFCYHRTSSIALAEDLTSETFFRALRAIVSFRWQGRDFGAWLTTIARNLVTDHYKSSRARFEMVPDGLPEQRDHSPGPEDLAIARLTHETLAVALSELPTEQRDCLVMRFLQGLSIVETAQALERSTGAVKQLQLRAVRNLARSLPVDVR